MFVCDRCGLCCRNINMISELKDFDSGNGVCIHLTDENLCEIYLNRPDICNTLMMFEKKYKHIMAIDEYEQLNKEGCMLLRHQTCNGL